MSTASGIITMAEALAHQEKLLKDPDFDPNFGQLLDVTHITEVELSAPDVRRLALKTVFSPNSRRAILVKSDLQYGLARMFGMVRDGFGEKGIRVFRKLEDALEWVLAEDRL